LGKREPARDAPAAIAGVATPAAMLVSEAAAGTAARSVDCTRGGGSGVLTAPGHSAPQLWQNIAPCWLTAAHAVQGLRFRGEPQSLQNLAPAGLWRSQKAHTWSPK